MDGSMTLTGLAGILLLILAVPQYLHGRSEYGIRAEREIRLAKLMAAGGGLLLSIALLLCCYFHPEVIKNLGI
jgi:hypothetical protein